MPDVTLRPFRATLPSPKPNFTEAELKVGDREKTF